MPAEAAVRVRNHGTRNAKNGERMSSSLRCAMIGLMMSVCALFGSAQNISWNAESELAFGNELPDAPTATNASQAAAGSVRGMVTDADGAFIAGAQVVLKNTQALQQSSSVTNENGAFQIDSVRAGRYKITVSAKGFAAYTSGEIVVHSGEGVALEPIVLQVAQASENIVVALSRHEIAEAQIKEEEQQRLAGIFPEFRVSYKWDAVPLSTKQKFEIAWKSSSDPTTVAFAGAVAGYEQARNNLRSYGQGMQGFGKRYGANYADAFSSTMIGGAILPSIFHEDPRYFVKGTGSTRSRILHAMEFPFVCRGDNGRSTPHLSFMLGAYASAELSNVYYPSSSRTNITLNNMLIDFGVESAADLLLEFVYPHITTHVPKTMDSSKQLILREGTPVALVVTEGVSVEDAQRGAHMSFALARDIKVDGVLVVKAGSKASGEAIGAGNASSDHNAIGVEIQRLFLEAGEEQVPLKGLKERPGDTDLYRLSGGLVAADDKKIRIHAGTVLSAYVAADVSLHSTK